MNILADFKTDNFFTILIFAIVVASFTGYFVISNLYQFNKISKTAYESLSYVFENGLKYGSIVAICLLMSMVCYFNQLRNQIIANEPLVYEVKPVKQINRNNYYLKLKSGKIVKPANLKIINTDSEYEVRYETFNEEKTLNKMNEALQKQTSQYVLHDFISTPILKEDFLNGRKPFEMSKATIIEPKKTQQDNWITLAH